ncbi:MAG: tRNA adenosine(34) deaminase TadA [Gammaproteobacteria bacterium]|nr:tRNA adenosine(34) deaminase TadA [Gammaproteobacteria bacterium]
MSGFSKQDHLFMQHALKLAETAVQNGEVPIGAVLVLQGKIIGEGFNTSISDHDPTAHAEMNAIRQAAKRQQNYRLPGSTLYVTLEPCSMCAGALIHSRVERLVYAASDTKTGACGSVFDVISTNQRNHRVQYEKGLLGEEAGTMLSNFFKKRRADKKMKQQEEE